MTTDSTPGATTSYEQLSPTTLRITRRFRAPAARVFDAWTNPAIVPRWLGPARNTMVVCEIDARVGGEYRYAWTLASGSTMAMGGTFLEVEPPHRLVASEYFDDFPGTSTNTLVLTEDGDETICEMTAEYEHPDQLTGSLAGGMKDGIDEGFTRLDALFAA